ncbi:MAG TPA: ABC transporter permease [Flavobacterium sp.]|nr:ABC transporter permease [Flavobacterium sp.]
MRLYSSIIKADYLQRTRSYTFIITLLASVYGAYLFVPPAGAHYATVRIGQYVGINNAAWVGHVTAIMASTFLWLIGFYIINNGIRRDKETGVGQIIATTAISNFDYLLAKAVSNFLVLLSITSIIILMAFGLILTRSSNYNFSVSQFLLPYIFTTLPSIFFLSALAVLMEVVFGKRTNLLNVSFFFLLSLVVGMVNTSHNPNMKWIDILGNKYLTANMSEALKAQHPLAESENAAIGFTVRGKEIETKYFVFEGSDWSFEYIISRIAWIAIAVALVYMASRLFNRFDEKITIQKKKKVIIDEGSQPIFINNSKPAELPKAVQAFGIIPLVKTELLMLLRKGPRWFWIINLGIFIALFAVPIEFAHVYLLPVLWFLQVNRWADLSTKEKFYGTDCFIYASYKPLQRLLAAQILAGYILAFALALPLVLRHAISGNAISAASIVCGALLLIAFAVSAGIVSGGKRFFEIVLFMATYALIQGVPFFDYLGALHHNIDYLLCLLGSISVQLTIAFWFRKYQISHQ